MPRPLSEPEIYRLDNGQWAIDYGTPGPFVTLPPERVRGLVNALANAGWILSGGRPMRPSS